MHAASLLLGQSCTKHYCLAAIQVTHRVDMNVFPRDMGINRDGDGDKWKQGEFNSVPMKLIFAESLADSGRDGIKNDL